MRSGVLFRHIIFELLLFLGKGFGGLTSRSSLHKPKPVPRETGEAEWHVLRSMEVHSHSIHELH